MKPCSEISSTGRALSKSLNKLTNRFLVIGLIILLEGRGGEEEEDVVTIQHEQFSENLSQNKKKEEDWILKYLCSTCEILGAISNPARKEKKEGGKKKGTQNINVPVG